MCLQFLFIVDNLFCLLNTITGRFAAQAILNAAVGVDVFFTMRVLYIILLSAGIRHNLVFDNFGSINSITLITHKVPVIIVFNSGLKDYNKN